MSLWGSDSDSTSNQNKSQIVINFSYFIEIGAKLGLKYHTSVFYLKKS